MGPMNNNNNKNSNPNPTKSRALRSFAAAVLFVLGISQIKRISFTKDVGGGNLKSIEGRVLNRKDVVVNDDNAAKAREYEDLWDDIEQLDSSKDHDISGFKSIPEGNMVDSISGTEDWVPSSEYGTVISGTNGSFITRQVNHELLESNDATRILLKNFHVESTESDVASLEHCDLSSLDSKAFDAFRDAVLSLLDIPKIASKFQLNESDVIDEITLQSLDLFARSARVCDYTKYRAPIGPGHDDYEQVHNMVKSLPVAPSDEVRIVFLISAFDDYEHLHDLISTIHLPQHLIIIHLDRRTPEEFALKVREMAAKSSNVAVLQHGTITYQTDSISQIFYELMRFVTVDLDMEYDFLITLSATTYPLYEAHELARFLKTEPKRIRLGKIIYGRGSSYCHKIAESIQFTFSRGMGGKGFANLVGYQKEVERLAEEGITIPPSSAFVPTYIKSCQIKTISGNTASYDRDAVVALMSSNVTEFLSRFKNSGSCCPEEASWSGALSMIGRRSEISMPGMMWQAWKCRSAMSNEFLKYDNSSNYCLHVLDTAGGDVRNHRLYGEGNLRTTNLAGEKSHAGRKIFGVEGLRAELRAARNRGQLFFRKVSSDDTYWTNWVRANLFGSKAAGPSSSAQDTAATTKGQEPAKSSHDINATDIHIKVPYPVFVASLYKSGTTSVDGYFKCGKQKAIHYGGGKHRTGPCMQRNYENDIPLLQDCGGAHFDIFSDNANLKSPKSCFDPSVHALDALYKSYPNATIMLAVRDSHAWIDSVDRYRFRNWSLMRVLQTCPDLWPQQKEEIGDRELTREEIRQFYLWHNNHVREFAAAHPTMTYVEVQLESDDTGSILQDKVGIPATCWKQKNINTIHKASSTA